MFRLNEHQEIFTGFGTIIFGSSLFTGYKHYLNDFSKALGETEQISLSMSVWTPVFLVFIASAIGMIYVNQK